MSMMCGSGSEYVEVSYELGLLDQTKPYIITCTQAIALMRHLQRKGSPNLLDKL